MRETINKYLFYVLFVLLATLAGCNQDDKTDFTRIDQKLEVQFALYDEAQDKGLQRVAVEGGVIKRGEWEAWLTLLPNDVIDDGELQQIKERQERTVEDRRLEAIASATLNLDLIRNDAKALDEYCNGFPKGAMLHIHPSGTRNRQTVKALLEKVNPVVNGPEILLEANDGKLTMLYPDEVAFLSDLRVLNFLDYNEAEQSRLLDFFFLPENPPTHGFKRFEAIFTINDLLKQDRSKEDWVEEKTHLDFLKRCAEKNVSYVEFTRVMWPDPSTFEQLHVWAKEWYEKTGVRVRWNSAFVRTGDYDANTAWAEELISVLTTTDYPELVGIDLLADETDTPALETGQNIYLPILAANKAGTIKLNRTMHAGELGNIHNVRDAMIMGVERVGHGVLLDQDPIALEYGVQKRLPIEINLYSNYRLQVNEDFSKHPFLKYLRLGLPISLSTDDEGMFVTDIANEYFVAIHHTDITHDELKQMAYNSLETAFADDQLKSEILQQLVLDFETFEAKWHQRLGQ